MVGLLFTYSRKLSGLLLAGLLLVWAPSALAAEHDLSCSPAAGQDRWPCELHLGESKLIEIDESYNLFSVADPEIAVMHFLDRPNQKPPKRLVYIAGSKVGYTSMILGNDDQRVMIDVTVTLDLTNLKKQIHDFYPPPQQEIKVYGTESGIVLAGTVSGPEIVEQVLRLASAYMPKAAGAKPLEEYSGTGKSGPSIGITNLLTVRGIQQVMLEVKIAEVNRNKGRDWQAALGAKHLERWDKDWRNFRGNIGTSPLGVPQDPKVETLAGGLDAKGNKLPSSTALVYDAGAFAGSAASMLMNFAGNPANVFLEIDNFTTALNFLEAESMAHILAEPKLVSLSGQPASFLAGGEFPIPTKDKDGNTVIEYKRFGVSLLFTPYVLSNGRINLAVNPEVSEIQRVDSLAGYIVPSLNTRNLSTTVELYDGQTLALAGLLRENMRETVSKVPGLGDLPILGALFRSSSFLQDKTDLIIAVTPHLVKPVAKEELTFPGDNVEAPSRLEFYLLGQLEGKATQKASTENPLDTNLGGGLEGDFGHQPLAR